MKALNSAYSEQAALLVFLFFCEGLVFFSEFDAI
jgi:hypothetical protein